MSFWSSFCSGEPSNEPSKGDDKTEKGDLPEDIKKFKTNPKEVLEALKPWVYTEEVHIQTRWFNVLGDLWEEKPPETREAMSDLVLQAMKKVHYSCINLFDYEGFVYYYQLPSYLDILASEKADREEADNAEADSVETDSVEADSAEVDSVEEVDS